MFRAFPEICGGVFWTEQPTIESMGGIYLRNGRCKKKRHATQSCITNWLHRLHGLQQLCIQLSWWPLGFFLQLSLWAANTHIWSEEFHWFRLVVSTNVRTNLKQIYLWAKFVNSATQRSKCWNFILITIWRHISGFALRSPRSTFHVKYLVCLNRFQIELPLFGQDSTSNWISFLDDLSTKPAQTVLNYFLELASRKYFKQLLVRLSL